MLPLTELELSLIKAANATIDAVPRGGRDRQMMDHSVGCAALTSTGRIFTGINVFHFSGGPCAENVALGNAAAAGVASSYSPGINSESLVAIVTVANDQRGVISPCGRCRQMLLDYYPNVRVIVKNEGGDLVTVGTRDLLPFAYIAGSVVSSKSIDKSALS